MPGWRPRAPLQDAARTPPVSALRPAQPPEVHHPDLKPRPRDADGAHDLAAHRVLLVAEYVLDTRAYPRARRVRRLLALRQRTISCGAPVDMALQALRHQARLNLHRAVGAVRPDPLAGIGEIEHIVQLLTVVHGRVRRIPFADQLVRLVHAEVVLVAEEARIVLLRPARVLVLLGILGGLLLPSLRRLAGLDRLVLLLRVALPGHRHKRGVNNLAAARNIALSLKMLAEALKQLVDQPGLRQRLTKQPDRGGIRHRVLELQIEKAHERYAVADQVLSPIVREIVERLQHQDLELQDRVIGLAAGVALALLGLRLRHGLDVSTEILPWHDLLDRFQRIAQSANRIQPALNIEKALLPHDPLAPSAHYRVRSPSQIRGDLARGIFRGAHPSFRALGATLIVSSRSPWDDPQQHSVWRLLVQSQHRANCRTNTHICASTFSTKDLIGKAGLIV